MKKLLMILSLLCLLACQKDFDELNDTDQRNVTFTFDPSGYFDEVLLCDGNEYHMCTSTNLDDGYGLRIVGYCYDAHNNLIAKSNVFGDLQHGMSIRFKHLLRDVKYHFLFVADIVEYDSEVDYYEEWFQLLTYNLEYFYVVSFERRTDKRYDILLSATVDMSPGNNTVAVDMHPIMYNGYVVFTNLSDAFEVNGTIMYYQKMKINDFDGENRLEHKINIPYGHSKIIVPITATYADNFFSFNMKKKIGNIEKTYSFKFYDREHRPFVATIDCTDTIKIKELILY